MLPCFTGIGSRLLRGFNTMDLLKMARADQALLSAGLRVEPDMVVQRSYEPTPDGWIETDVEIRCRKGLICAGKIDRYVAEVIAACDRRRPLGEVLTAIAASREIDTNALVSAF